MDYVKISKRLIDYYGCDHVWFDFTSIEGKVEVHKVSFIDGMIKRSLTSYDYSDFQRFSDGDVMVSTGQRVEEWTTRHR